MRKLRTKIEIFHEAIDNLALCVGDAQEENVLNGIWRTAFERGEQYMAKVMREGGHVVYDHKKMQP